MSKAFLGACGGVTGPAGCGLAASPSHTFHQRVGGRGSFWVKLDKAHYFFISVLCCLAAAAWGLPRSRAGKEALLGADFCWAPQLLPFSVKSTKERVCAAIMRLTLWKMLLLSFWHRNHVQNEKQTPLKDNGMYYIIRIYLTGGMYISHTERNYLVSDTLHIKTYKSSTWRRIGLSGQVA